MVLPSLKVLAAGAYPRWLCPSRFDCMSPDIVSRTGRNKLKSYEEIMEILEAFALTNSFRATGELVDDA